MKKFFMTLAAAALAVPAMFAQGSIAVGSSPENLNRQYLTSSSDYSTYIGTAQVNSGDYFRFVFDTGFSGAFNCGPISSNQVIASVSPDATGDFTFGSEYCWQYTGSETAYIKMSFDINEYEYTFTTGNSADVQEPNKVTFNITGVEDAYKFLAQPAGLTSSTYPVYVGSMYSMVVFQLDSDYTSDYKIASITCNASVEASNSTYQIYDEKTYWQVAVFNNPDMNNAVFTVTLEALAPEVGEGVYLGVDAKGEWPSTFNTQYALTDEGNGIYTGTFNFTEGQGINLWWAANASVNGAVTTFQPLGPNTEDKENLNPYGGEFGVDATTEGYWYVTADAELTVTLDMTNRSVTFSAPVVERSVSFKFSTLDNLAAPLYSYLTVTDLNSGDAVNIDANPYTYSFTGETMLSFVANDSYTITLSVDGLNNEDLEEYGIGEIITVDEYWADYMKLPLGSYILILNNSELADNLEFNIEVIYIQPEPVNKPVYVTLTFTGEDLEKDAYTYVTLTGEALDGGQLTLPTIKNNTTVFQCTPNVALNFEPADGYRIVSIYGTDDTTTNYTKIARPAKENGQWGVTILAGIEKLTDNVFFNITVAEGETSGVDSLGADAVNGPVYNLQGVKVANDANNLPAGLYIINGKKVLVK